MSVSKWDVFTFEEVVIDDTKRGTKIKKEDYLEQGLYPIIDQGQNQISGYSNNADGVYNDVPAIIFGDHTRVIKYINIPFFLGADGVKVLKCKMDNIDYKYLYYYYLGNEVLDTGYNRHFKWLKQIPIPIPPFGIQKQIAQTLDTASELLAMRKQQLAELDNLIKSIFFDMFGDPMSNASWPLERLEKISVKITDGTHQPPQFADKGIPFLFVSNIVNNEIVYNTEKFITENDYNQLIARTPVELGDILYTIVGSYGNPAMVRSNKRFCFQRHIAYIKPNRKSINPTYLFGALLSDHVRFQVEKRVKGVAQKTLNLSELKQIEIILPPMPLQVKFANLFSEIEEQKALVQKAINETQYLFDSLMSQYFD